jgi:hypothetical protein
MEQMLVFLIIGLIVAGIAAYFLFINYRKYSIIQKTETSNISMVYNGFYEVKGKIVPLTDQLVSPFTGKDCVYYHFFVEQKKSSGKSSHWVKIIDDKRSVKFGVDDGTGVAIVDMQNAEAQINVDTKARSGFLNSADEREVAVLEKYNKSNKTWIFEKTLRYTEKFLEVGDELYVLGEVNEKEDRYPVFRKAKMPLFVSDKSENELLSFFKTRIIVAIVAVAAVIALNVWIYYSMGK